MQLKISSPLFSLHLSLHIITASSNNLACCPYIGLVSLCLSEYRYIPAQFCVRCYNTRIQVYSKAVKSETSRLAVVSTRYGMLTAKITTIIPTQHTAFSQLSTLYRMFHLKPDRLHVEIKKGLFYNTRTKICTDSQ
jgi:hypothetical protein